MTDWYGPPNNVDWLIIGNATKVNQGGAFGLWLKAASQARIRGVNDGRICY